MTSPLAAWFHFFLSCWNYRWLLRKAPSLLFYVPWRYAFRLFLIFQLLLLFPPSYHFSTETWVSPNVSSATTFLPLEKSLVYSLENLHRCDICALPKVDFKKCWESYNIEFKKIHRTGQWQELRILVQDDLLLLVYVWVCGVYLVCVCVACVFGICVFIVCMCLTICVF